MRSDEYWRLHGLDRAIRDEPRHKLEIPPKADEQEALDEGYERGRRIREEVRQRHEREASRS